MTGAPKKRSVELLDTVEEGGRGVYSGSIGYFGFNGVVDLNIVIRTIVWEGESLSMGVGGAMHDPLALALVIDPTLVRTKPVHIGVDLNGSYTFGATVADFWTERGEPDNARIAYEVDADRFFKLMFDLLR